MASPASRLTVDTYTVRQGDTLWSIARRAGTTPERLAVMNGINVNATLKLGRTLKVPVPAQGRTRPRGATSSVAPRSAPMTSAPVARVHRVRAGETLWRIARQYGTSPERLAAMNGMSAEAILSIGKELKVPGVPRAAARPSRAAALGAPGASAAVASATQNAMRRRLAALPSRGERWASDLLTLSRRFLGVRYRWGGTSPAGFDCSGLIYYVYGRMGVTLPRTTYDMFEAGVPVPRDGLQDGDIVFFETVSPGPSHAGIYLGDGHFIHSSSAGGRVRITSMDDDYYAPRYLGARRF
jgi:cell wall-associated NlpC family hydrolase